MTHVIYVLQVGYADPSNRLLQDSHKSSIPKALQHLHSLPGTFNRI